MDPTKTEQVPVKRIPRSTNFTSELQKKFLKFERSGLEAEWSKNSAPNKPRPVAKGTNTVSQIFKQLSNNLEQREASLPKISISKEPEVIDAYPLEIRKQIPVLKAALQKSLLFQCSCPKNCRTLAQIMESYRSPLIEDRIWALLYQMVLLYRAAGTGKNTTAAQAQWRAFHELELVESLANISIHADGSMHLSCSNAQLAKKLQQGTTTAAEHLATLNVESFHDDAQMLAENHRKVLNHLGRALYAAIDYALPFDHEHNLSRTLEDLILYMIAEDAETSATYSSVVRSFMPNAFDYVEEICRSQCLTGDAELHYRKVRRDLVSEAACMQQVLLRRSAGCDDNRLTGKALPISPRPLRKQAQWMTPGSANWSQRWLPIMDELKRGVKLRKVVPQAKENIYKPSPYEQLMDDIRNNGYRRLKSIQKPKNW